ncbi:hypothetical protein CYMTET_27472 [Cymbomonas tetramitiformis]|uniref:VPS9 domain-containing protein n=1 Tax=Cymbomonas tetramitiformis TaxID=36881 RepID=A0AAE0FPX8_9CHLO|nr:hypothetical protein CYMTET_27472 [Cymbomonas tetramitiformis]
MSDGDMFTASTAPLTFHNFLEKMRQPAAADLVRSIKSFIASFQVGQPDPERDSLRAQEFMTSSEGSFRTNPLWRNASEEEIEAAGEGLEKYLMTKLYARTFAVTEEDKKEDAAVYNRTVALAFMRPEHLDIPLHYRNEQCWLLAQKELQKINQYKAPRDKLVCILNCCRVISNLLNVSADENSPPGADDFLPVLIYVVMKANPPQLNSNLEYILRFRLASRLRSEAQYFFTNLVSAVSFIKTVQATMLTDVSNEEFDRNMQLAGLGSESASEGLASVFGGVDTASPQERPRSGSATSTVANEPHAEELKSMEKEYSQESLNTADTFRNADFSGEGRKLSIATLSDCPSDLVALEAAGKRLLHNTDSSEKLQHKHPFLHTSVNDLRVSNVETLLQAYKDIVMKYEGLSLAVSSKAAMQSSGLTADAEVPAQPDSQQDEITSGLTETPTEAAPRIHPDDVAANSSPLAETATQAGSEEEAL